MSCLKEVASMRCLTACLVLFLSTEAAAQPLAPPPRAEPAPGAAPAPTERELRENDAPPARTGFQMHFVPLTGVMFPFGDATSARGDSLSNRYSWQWMPLEVGLGAKIIDELYVGGYFNFGVGWEGGDYKTGGRCNAGDGLSDDVNCSSTSFRVGIELRYTFTPEERLSGWIGYGVGITSATQTISDAGRYSETSTARGVELARLSGGLDVRASKGFGLGPYVLGSIGRFSHAKTEIQGATTFDGSIENPALHLWLSVGLRMVVFP
jgi:hypothetical protein